jgi:hypothetical protein
VPTSTPDLRKPTATPVPPGKGGAIQQFERGTMVYAGPELRKIYVLWRTEPYGDPLQPARWKVYDDTYSDR